MNIMKYLTGAGVAIMLATPLAWSQTVVSVPGASTTVTTTTTAPNSPPYVVNPNDPVQFPAGGVGMSNASHEGGVKAAFVDQQIAAAKAEGKDVSAAETQEIQGQADLKKGLNNEASEHFDSALRSIGILANIPNTQ
ncbi:MAG: hypothetical protein ACLQU2_04425 [Candidatus Binataceae bacterium]